MFPQRTDPDNLYTDRLSCLPRNSPAVAWCSLSCTSSCISFCHSPTERFWCYQNDAPHPSHLTPARHIETPYDAAVVPATGAKSLTSTPTTPGTKEEGDQGEEESASNVLRRLSSPIFGTAGFASDSDDNNGNGNEHYDSDCSQDGDEDEEEDEVKERAAEQIQR